MDSIATKTFMPNLIGQENLAGNAGHLTCRVKGEVQTCPGIPRRNGVGVAVFLPNDDVGTQSLIL